MYEKNDPYAYCQTYYKLRDYSDPNGMTITVEKDGMGDVDLLVDIKCEAIHNEKDLNIKLIMYLELSKLANYK